ncbi:hypothetical protein AB0F64_31270 [Streptomyces sp. NPDC026294]|uniref:hypothetical protein n=1 Tax=Streptomyces sp. NPDC026294 TaxID=3155362 RepID=UPI0033D97909
MQGGPQRDRDLCGAAREDTVRHDAVDRRDQRPHRVAVADPVRRDEGLRAADLGSDTASAYCARDARRVPVEDTAWNFSFSAAASLRVQQTIEDSPSPSLAPLLKRSRTPAMLMIAECTSQVRQWETGVLAADPAIRRTQCLPGVSHHMWNGLDDNDRRAAAVITAFLDDRPAPLPDYPARAGILAFLRDHRRAAGHLFRPARPESRRQVFCPEAANVRIISSMSCRASTWSTAPASSAARGMPG